MIRREEGKLGRVTRSGTQNNSNINFYFVCRKADLAYKKRKISKACLKLREYEDKESLI